MMAISRRGFVSGAGALCAASLTRGNLSRAQSRPATPLRIVKRSLDVKGRAATVYGIENGSGQTGLEMLAGERFRINLTNAIDVESLIHWHGLTPPIAQDGVPLLSQAPLQPGKSHDYDFPVRRTGTHWMHSHVGLQEQQLLAAPLIVRETAEPVFDEQEHVVLLHDFTFRDPADILAELKGGGAHATHAMERSPMANTLNDIVYDAYLANDRTLDDPQVVTVAKNGQVRLRVINGAAASNMWIDLGRLEGELIAVDGNAIFTLRGSMFPLAIAQRADVRLKIPSGGGSFPVLFRPEGVGQRTGIVLATAGASITRVAGDGDIAPALDLSFERRFRAVAELPREPVSRTEMLMLTGAGDHMWGLNGKSSMHDTLFTVREGERIEVIMHNTTAMAHPMHLHGHYFKVTAIGSTRIDGAIRDTVLVPPAETVTIMFDADNPGTWAFHCHHIYHMNSGMMGVIAYTNAA